ncbi:N-dimethylarginine dimethylaminohydrolase [Rhodococcus spelaei]|uniref:N-dimethylarginine dimethylaminohydrolase n=1 Tax=Rhodococcus spelaei TaxID=2546320 RepID=A0A541B0Q3_9NOCA|nr:dimethylargininase [Rhodococcus spelaei]TQF65888.1 N-dimethylarginine dimethylaminohydrolase [Rhodococcus spelaei]
MCPPTYFDVNYSINEWMDPTESVDTTRANDQWQSLVDTYRRLGHRVHLVDPVPGLPDMVFVTDSGLVVDGVALGARYRSDHRAPEADHVLRWFVEHDVRRPTRPVYINEGEGDLLVVGDIICAGTGFRTDERAHAEVERHLRRRVVTLRLVDPRYYHLNTALGVIDDRTIAYLPSAFDERSRLTLRALFPDAILADESDAAWLGLNLVSDGANVVMAGQATSLAAQLRERGYRPVPVDMSEFLKSGGGIKCCTMELRGWVEPGERP